MFHEPLPTAVLKPEIESISYLFETEDLVIDLRKVVSLYKHTFGFPESDKYVEIILEVGEKRALYWRVNLKYWDELKTAWRKVVNGNAKV